MNKEGSRYDRVISRIRNNRITTLMIALGTIVIALSTFTDAAKNLWSLVSERSPAADVSGRWTSEAITNPFDKTDTFKLTFVFQVKGDALLGNIRKTSTKDRYGVTIGIIDGKIKGDGISFSTPEQSWAGSEKVSYRNYYNGTVSDGEIEFVLQSDRPWGFPQQEFLAKRQ